jgi:hypothetical protein
MNYPKWKYHPSKEPRLVQTQKAEAELGPDWFNSPADFGVETAPGLEPSAEIAANKPKVKHPGKPAGPTA